MSMSAQMASIVENIAAFKAGLEAAKAQENEEQEILDPATFCMILSGVPSFRRLPGVPEHMGFQDGYHCDTPEHAQELRDYLESVFGIHDADSLATQKVEFFHTFNEYFDFACEWDGHPNFSLDDLDDEGRKNYIASRDFAENLRDLVHEHGFLAWDIGERIMLTRAAFACDIIDEAAYIQMMSQEGHACNEIFDNFIDFATSALCGAVYYMFVSMGRTEDEEGLAPFLDINLKIVSKLFQDGIWSTNAWCEKSYKELAIHAEQIQQLLPENTNTTGIAADRILCDGFRVSVMLREPPQNPNDSGWRFFAGDEDLDYIKDPKNFGGVDLNLIVNYSPDVIPFLDAPVGTMIVRDENGELHAMQNPNNNDGDSPDDPIAFG